MARPWRIAIFITVGVLVVAGAVWGGLAVRSNLRYGYTADESQLSFTVDRGDRLTLVVYDRGGSVGDKWSYRIDPATGASYVDDEGPRNRGGLIGCCSGDHRYIFRAAESGQVTITLVNCYRGCRTDADRAESREVTWTITVR